MAILQIPPHVAGADEDMQRSLELRGLVHALLRYLWFIVLCAITTGVIAWMYVRRLPDMFRSTAVIEIQPRNDRLNSLGGGEEELKDPEAVETTVQNFRHRSLMERVAKSLSLDTDSDFLGYSPSPSRPVSLDSITDRLLGDSTASRRSNTRLIDVTFVHRDPIVARKVTNALVDQFVEQGKEEHLKGLKEQNDLLMSKYTELKAKLTHSEQALQDYKKDNLKSESLESVSVEDRRNYVEDKLRGLNADLLGASAERRGMESDRGLITRAGEDPKQLLGIASITLDPQVASAQAQLSKAQTDLAGLSERYGEKHPRMIEERAQVESARAALTQAARLAPSHIDSRYNAVVAKEKSLQGAVSSQEQALLSLEQRLIPYRVLVREFESDRALTETVLQKLKESTLALGGGDQGDKGNDKSGNFQVVEPAVSAVSLANRRLFIIIGITMAGMLLGAGLVATLHLLDTSIRTVDSAERLLGLPVLATVPIMPRSSEKGGMLALLNNPNTPEAESFRTLRVALSLLGPKNENRIFLFTSAVPGEGKSLTAANAAIAFAQQGYKTLLVEADLRRPSLATKLLGMPGKQVGLGDAMAGKETPVTDTPIPKLFLLAAGAHTANPAELLASVAFQELVRWMKINFDRIVIDTAPINVVSDTLNIVQYASVICLVVRSNSTSRKVVLRAVELLRRTGVKPDGILLNYMPKWKGIDNHYDYSSSKMYGDSQTYGDAYATDLSKNGSGGAEVATKDPAGAAAKRGTSMRRSSSTAAPTNRP